MRKLLVIFVIFSLLFSIPAFSQYKDKSLPQIKTLMNSALKLLLPFLPHPEQQIEPRARILKIIKNQSGKVDFYAQITTDRFRDEQSFAMTLGVVMAVVTRCTRQVSWSSDKLYFCPANTDKPKYWISTSRADVICRQINESTWDDRITSKVILKALHKM